MYRGIKIIMENKEQVMEELLELAWVIIANAFEGDWDKAAPKWKKAAEKWRDDYASLLEETKERIRKKSGEQAFKDFACSPENRGQKNLANLAKQFLYEEPTLESPKEPENKPGLETATGGPKTTAIPKKGFTPEEARELRKRDPQKYNKLVSEGRMKIIDKK